MGVWGGPCRKHSHRRHHSNTGSLEKDEVSASYLATSLASLCHVSLLCDQMCNTQELHKNSLMSWLMRVRYVF